MVHGSLFSGIGGFDLASQWMDWTNRFHCENNEFGQKVLMFYWPNAISYGDITTTDFTIHRGKIDVLTGGFPCQPYSVAGKRKGDQDDRHLWPHMLRAIQEICPPYLVGENVPGLITWSNGLVFEQICTDLEAQGYEVAPILLPASGIDAPHKRERLWIVAYNAKWHDRQNNRKAQTGQIQQFGESLSGNTDPNGKGIKSMFGEIEESGKYIGHLQTGRFYKQITADRNSLGRGQGNGQGKSKFINKDGKGADFWKEFPSQPPVCSGNDGLSVKLDGITFSKWRIESIKGYGNAIVPQLAYIIFQVIQKHYEQQP